MRRPATVLFLCAHNACRSQMAEGFARHYGGEAIRAFSAGTQPTEVHPLTAEVMREVGVDLSGHRAKGLDQVPSEADVVVTVCDQAAEACPLFPGAPRMVHWSLPDPAAAPGDREQVLAAFRQVRDRIEVLVRGLVAELSDKP